MKMVGMIITRIWFSGRKSRSVNNSFQQPDLGPKWDSTPRGNRPDKTNPPPGADFSISPSGFNYDMQSIGYQLNANSVPGFTNRDKHTPPQATPKPQ